jgi:hypothetical protein
MPGCEIGDSAVVARLGSDVLRALVGSIGPWAMVLLACRILLYYLKKDLSKKNLINDGPHVS